MFLVAILVISGLFLLPLPSAGTSGGPDAYGYIWVDNRLPTPTIPYSWIDITSTGIRLSMKDDGCTYEIPVGFQFRFYGTTVDQVYVCSNGFITFSVPDSYFAEPPIPSLNPPNDRIVGLGLDLNPAASGGVYFRSQPGTTPQRFIITWQAVYQVRTTNPQTFQIILEQNRSAEDGRIRLQYMTLTGVTSALVGIENSDGSSGLAYPGPLGNNLAVEFFPPSDATLPPDQLSVARTVLAPLTVAQGSGNVPMLALDLSTATNWVDVTAVRVTLSGIGADPTDVPTATLWLEADGDGEFTPGPDPFLAIGAFEGGPPRATLNLASPLRVALGAPRRVYVAYDVSPNAGVGEWIGARLVDASSILVMFPDTVTGAFPIDSYEPLVRTRIVASADTLYLAATEGRLPSTVRQWDTDRPILSLRLSADKNDVAVAGIRVPFQGTLEARDLWAVKVVRDLDADGNYTPDLDKVLAVAVPSGSPPAVLLLFNLSVASGAPEDLLLTLDVAPDATPGRTLAATLQYTDIRLPTGSADRMDAGNFPATSGNGTIAAGQRPALTLPWSAFPPQANGAWRTDEYVLGPAATVSLMRPGGNQVAGVLTTENNATTLFVAIGATHDLAAQPGDGASIAFDTDGNGLPTDGADDVFAVNASGGSWYRYNASAGAWTQVAPCDRGPNPSAPACASAIGFTQVGRTAHQFYEFAIPLAALRVPQPIQPGTSLRFALSGPPYNGVADRTLVSTWPLLFGPPLSFFGELRLNPGPTPNTPPTLNWTGDPGYETDAVEPATGDVGDEFVWKIAYFDVDNDPPAIGYPQLHIFRNDVEIPDSPFQLWGVTQDATYTDGKAYARSVPLTICGGSYVYIITARDARGLPLPETETPLRQGPYVRCPNESPVFSLESVTPFVGDIGTAFAFRVAYQDPEGQPPAFIEVNVQRGDENLTSAPLRLIGWLGAIGNYTQGAWYEENITLTEPGTNYTFQFRASDGTATFLSSRFLGPYVTVPPPDMLSVLSLDNLPPPVVDEGARLVPFLRLTLYTSDPDVDVVTLLVDRIGTASVDDVLIVNDTDRSSTWTPSDVLLDVRPGAPPQIALSVPVHVVPGTPVYLLLLANLTTPGNADATVGFEIRDSSYVIVGPRDAVLPFAPIRSARASVNVAPLAAGVTVDGHADGTPGVNHIVTDRPSLAWRFQDENVADVAPKGHNVSVWTSSSPGALLWYLNESDSATAATYDGPALADGGSYVVRVRATDGRLWSATAEARFRLNRPPIAPALQSPLDTTIGLPAQVVLQWGSVTDPDGDSIAYHWWVSETSTFTPAMDGGTAGTSVTVNLALGREYYWKVGASDGYEFVGNATVWSFRTAPPIVPVRGEVRGRVVNGAAPISGALVELLVNDAVVAAAITASDGTFRLQDLALRPYTLRASAFGFQTRTMPAEPTEASPVVDLQDVALTPTGGQPGGGGTNPPSGISGWQLAMIAGIFVAALTIAITSLAVVLRRRRGEPAGKTEAGASRRAARPSEVAAVYQCPVCGREVAAGATRCECGAVFEK